MRSRPISMVLATATAVAVFALTAQLSAGQTPAPGTEIPRTADGKPNFSGVWQVLNTASWNIQDHHADSFPGLPIQFSMPGGMGVLEGNVIPYTPAAAAKQKENFANRAKLDPETKCFLPGVPRTMYMPFPFQIFQTPAKLTMLFEYVHATRFIHTNGTPHPPGHIDWWMGDSRGRWEGDTLVVDVVDFNDQTWFDRAGNFHSDQLHLVERYTLTDPDHITYDVTVEDPQVFTRPWRMSMILYRHKEKNVQILEYECYAFDNEFHAPVPN